MQIRSSFLPVFGLLGMLLAGSAQAQLPDFTPLVEANKPAVVSVEATRQGAESPYQSQGREIPREDLEEFMRRFFGNPYEGGPQQRPPRQAVSRGSGFIISADGYVLTNNHVVEDADEVVVRLNDRREMEAEVIGADPATDIALLKVDASGLPRVKLGDSSKLDPGEWVVAIGSPFNFDYSVTAGIVSAKGRSFARQQYVPFIQTDVAINPGNSGGPLIDMNGEVVGINSQIFSSSGGYMGLSFSIPVDVAMDIVEQLRDNGSVARGFLGVTIQDVTAAEADFWGLKRARGALVNSVMPDSPAAKAGVKSGDIILSFNEKAIERQGSLPPVVGRVRPGETVPMTVLRDRKEKTLKVTVEQLPVDGSDAASNDEADEQAHQATLGLAVADVPADMSRELDIDHGALVREVTGRAALRAGIRRGDVILQIGSVEVEDAAAFEKMLADHDEVSSIPLLVQRGNVRSYVVIER